MSDAAAFFASKKKKKKTFKFNANKIDATTVTHTVHVDAPAISTAAVEAALASSTIADTSQNATAASTTTTPANGTDGTAAPTTGGEWDDEALAASYARKGAPAAGATAELLDMKAFDAKRRDQDDIVERMRVEETKAQLAAAKAGMEREAARLKEERENKDFVAVKKPEPARGLGAFGGSKWVPPHMRAGGGVPGLSRSRMGNVGNSKLNTEDENLFPDLAAADAILEKKKEDTAAYKVVKKTPVGGGATWGSRPPVNVRPPTNIRPTVNLKPKEPEPVPEPKAPEPEPTPAPAAEAPAPVVSAAPVVKKKLTKKKKKDLSTFKPAS